MPLYICIFYICTTYVVYIIQSSTEGHFDSFHVLATVSSAALDIGKSMELGFVTLK